MTQLKESRFSIGARFTTKHKVPMHCVVTDILKTYNSRNELVSIRYVATHQFLGQTVTDYDVVETTIARGLVEY